MQGENVTGYKLGVAYTSRALQYKLALRVECSPTPRRP